MAIYNYGGTWGLPNNSDEFNGELIIDTEKGAIQLTIYGDNKDFKDLFLTQTFNRKFAIINGTLTNGALISLLSCTVHKRNARLMGNTIVIISAQFAVLGKHFINSDEIKFKHIWYSLSNTIEWSNLCRFEWDSNNGNKEENHIGFLWKNKEQVEIIVDENTQIAFIPAFGKHSFTYYTHEINLSQSIYVDFTYNNSVSLEESLNHIESIIRLISFAIGDKVSIVKMEYFDSEIPIEIIYSKAEPYKESKHHIYDMYFTLDNLVESDQRGLKNWFEKIEVLRPILNLYSSVYQYPEMPLEMHF